jgi:hypothetical protein
MFPVPNVNRSGKCHRTTFDALSVLSSECQPLGQVHHPTRPGTSQTSTTWASVHHTVRSKSSLKRSFLFDRLDLLRADRLRPIMFVAPLPTVEGVPEPSSQGGGFSLFRRHVAQRGSASKRREICLVGEYAPQDTQSQTSTDPSIARASAITLSLAGPGRSSRTSRNVNRSGKYHHPSKHRIPTPGVEVPNVNRSGKCHHTAAQ